MLSNRIPYAFTLAAFACAGRACSTDARVSTPSGTGGRHAVSSGGSSSAASGGAATSGGSVSTPTGGSTLAGGAIGSGGLAGATNTGGVTSNGGVTNTGGATSTAGASTAGAMNAGGVTGSAGAMATGGVGIGGSTAGAGNVACVPAQRTVVVAADGSGQFTTIKAALDSIPAGSKIPTLVSIRNGIYRERLALSAREFITLRGEDRAKTRIEYDQLCSDGADGFGCSMLYLAADTRDIAFENLTIANTHVPADILVDKTLALRSAGASTHIVLKNVDVLGKGGDTLYLEKNGYYYLSGVKISGTFHIIVPRGTSWVTDTTFECLSNPDPLLPGCLFNENNLNETQKLVIRNSTVGVNDAFNLGSYFRDTAWYFIDVKFSDKMMDKPIWRDPKNDAASSIVIKWGERIYFAGSVGPAYAWLKDNIAASAAQTKERVTLDWVFPDWNPGSSLVCGQ